MKITLTACYLLLLALPAFSQESPFRIGIKGSPDMSFRTLYCDDEDVDFVKDIRDDIELPMPTFTTGIAFGYQLNDRFELETGAYYAKKGFHTEKLNYSTVEDPEGSGSYARIVYAYSYLDVP